MKINSMRFRIFLGFMFIIVFVLVLIWVFEILFFERIYKSIKTTNFESVTERIIDNYGVFDYDDYIFFSSANDCSITIFKLEEGNKISYVFNTSRNHQSIELNFEIFDMLDRLQDQDSVSFYIQENGTDSLISGQKFIYEGETIYVYASTTISPISTTVQIMTLLLILISLIAIFVTFIVTIIFSKSLTIPIQNMSNKAKELASGNLDIHFSSKEYSEVEQLSDTLNYSIEEIKKSQIIQREVIQNVSHELRTPLTLIKSYAELIKDFSGSDEEKRQKHLEIILEEVTKLEYIVNDIIDLSKMQAKTMMYAKEEFNLTTTLGKLIDFYKSKYTEFEFETNIDEEINILADKKRIEQVITNFMNNAINYSREDNKKIIVTAKKIDNNKVKFSVQDFGIGISEEDQKYIFDRHFRATSSKRAVAGCGIGLTIVKEILNYHNFAFGVISQKNQGSTFYVIFDLINNDMENDINNETLLPDGQ